MAANHVGAVAMAPCVFGTCSLALGAGFSLVPVGSTGPHAITGQEIRLPAGAATLTLEIRIFDWDPNHDGNPTLYACQAQIHSAGYTSGTSGSLSAGRQLCVTNADCPAGHNCLPFGVCDMSNHVFIDASHPNYVFSGVNEVHAVDFSIANVRYGAVVDPPAGAVLDTGAAKYVGTLRLDVSPDARGTFTVGFIGFENGDGSFVMLGPGIVEFAAPLVPALITIVHDDCNVNGVHDALDISGGTSRDCNGSGVPDECENDCNGNGWEDSCDLSAGCSDDCNGNGTPDECEEDCNHNGAADACDIAGGASADANGDGVPDECQQGPPGDCNDNGVPDWIDIGGGASNDCNFNGIPDECEAGRGAGDCNHNGIPDGCESDCNANGTPDACDISAGTSLDVNGNGVPDECVTTVAWTPVHASRGYYINGRSIVLPAGGARITLDASITGWDLDRNGNPLLIGYQLILESSGFTSGSSGSLGPAQLACTSDDDCRDSSLCISGICDNRAIAFIDISRADFPLSGHGPIAVVDVSQPNFRMGVATSGPGAAADDGRTKYAATLILDASTSATGTFTIGFQPEPEPDTDGTFLMAFEPQNWGWIVYPPIGAMLPATITIVDDCNANGTPDQTDISGGASQDCDGNGFPDECDMTLAPHPDCNNNGVYDGCESQADCNQNGTRDFCDLADATSEDANGNGVPDECESEAPHALAKGGRHVEIEPAAGTQAVALRVTSPNHACLSKYVTIMGGVGRLSSTPDYRTPQEWGRILVTGAEITPAAMYDVAAELGDGVVSTVARATTGRWGNVVAPDNVVNFQDIGAIVQRFKGDHCAVPTALADIYPAVPDGLVNFLDINAAVGAFKGLAYPFGQPCP